MNSRIYVFVPEWQHRKYAGTHHTRKTLLHMKLYISIGIGISSRGLQGSPKVAQCLRRVTTVSTMSGMQTARALILQEQSQVIIRPRILFPFPQQKRHLKGCPTTLGTIRTAIPSVGSKCTSHPKQDPHLPTWTPLAVSRQWAKSQRQMIPWHLQLHFGNIMDLPPLHH